MSAAGRGHRVPGAARALVAARDRVLGGRLRPIWLFPGQAPDPHRDLRSGALFALSLDLILGYAGIISLGHAAFFGLGAILRPALSPSTG